VTLGWLASWLARVSDQDDAACTSPRWRAPGSRPLPGPAGCGITTGRWPPPPAARVPYPP